MYHDDYYGLDDDNYGEMDSFGKIKLSEFKNKPWSECIYEVPRKTTGKIEKVEGYTTDKILAKVNELVDAVNEINENYACIAALTDIRKRLDALEKCVKNKRGEE